MSSATVRIDAAAPAQLPSWRELWSYRDFLRLMVWREVHLRYRHTLVGVGWVFLQPLLTTLAFGLIIPKLMGGAPVGVPYALFTYCGLVPWTCFAHSATRSSLSIVDHADLVRNMYFPRVLLPTASALAALADLAVAATLLLPMMWFYDVTPTMALVALPAFLLMLAAINLGLGLILAAVQVAHRDIFFLTQFLIQIGLLATPVWFPLSIFPERVQTLIGLNPMAGVVLGFRWALLGGTPPPLAMLAVSGIASVVLLAAGMTYFRFHEQTVSDVV